MRFAALLFPGVLLLAACGQAEEPADAPAGALEALQQDLAAPSVPQVLTTAQAVAVCRVAVAAVHGRSGDELSVGSGSEAGVVALSWPAPVDGGRQNAECRIDGDRVLWKPLDRPVAEENRWMDQPGDPAIRFGLEGATVTVSQSLPDGTTTTTVEAVTLEEEAR